MDHEPAGRRRPCDHDRDVMCPSRFFDQTLRTHLDRQRLHACMDGKTHWVFVVTPECTDLMQKLAELCVERCGAAGAPMLVTALPTMPMFVCFPRDQLALEELADFVDFSQASREDYERKDFITITSLNNHLLNQVVSTWINVDHLLN
jgi:hypothetical protein